MNFNLFQFYKTGSLFRNTNPIWTSFIKNQSIYQMDCAKKRRLPEDCGDNDSLEQILVDNIAPASKINKKLKADVDVSLDISSYYIENGLRKVYPYIYSYHSYCKGRWIGQKIVELFAKEFRAVPHDEMISRINKGHLKVNGNSVDVDYVLKDNDFITNQVHRHEFPVLAAPIPIIHIDQDLLVIDKPPSVPVHPCGKYRLNSITSILEKENKLKDLHVVHRLDRLTSGVMIMARTKTRAQKLHEEMRNREMHKEYVCRVDGKFPDGTIECEMPIETLSHRVGICIASLTGKPSKTLFERLNYNGKSSTVLCKPLTGRMHQIRVHLQYLGYPILNDSFYNNLVFGPNKGKEAQYEKSIDQLMKDIDLDHQRSKHIIDNDSETVAEMGLTNLSEENVTALKALDHYTSQESWIDTKKSYQYDSTKISQQDECAECKIKCQDPRSTEQFIYLHALRYKGKDWSYESQMPVWAKETWNND